MCLHIGSTDDGHFPPYLLNCTGYTENQLKAIIAVFTSASIISFLIGAFVFAVILYFKAHKTTLQRMFVYLVITTGIELTTFCLTIIHLFHYSGDGVLCESLGFINQYSGSIAKLLNVAIALKLLVIVHKYLIKNRSNNQPGKGTKKYPRILEGIFFLIVTIFPMTYVWFPFTTGGYGFTGVACWVKTFNEDCANVGFKPQIILYGIGLAHDTITIVVSLLLGTTYLSWVYCSFSNHRVTLLVRKTLVLMIFIFTTSVVSMLVGLLHRFYINSYAYYVITSFVLPFTLVTIPLGYLIYMNLCTNNNSCFCCSRCIDSKQNAETQPLHGNNAPNDNQPPTHESAPSTTVPLPLEHTGIGLTTDTNRNNPELLDQQQTREPVYYHLTSVCCFSTRHNENEAERLVHSNNKPTNPPSTRVSGPSTTKSLTLVDTGIGLTTDTNNDP